MTYALAITQHPKYQHTLVTGDNSRENVENYLDELPIESRSLTHRKCNGKEQQGQEVYLLNDMWF